jgi:hypothetical protein
MRTSWLAGLLLLLPAPTCAQTPPAGGERAPANEGVAWAFTFAPKDGKPRAPRVVAVSPDTVVTRRGQLVWALSLEDGSVRWEGDALAVDSTFGAQGDLLVERHEGRWRAWDVYSGEPIALPDFKIRAVLERKGWVYVQGPNAAVAFDPKGVEAWAFEPRGKKGPLKVAAIAVSQELLLVGAERFVYGIDREAGKRKWVYDLGEEVISRTRKKVVTRPWSVDQLLSDGKSAVARDGERLWFLSDKGRKREELEVEKADGDVGGLRGGDLLVFPAKRAGTLLVRRRRSGGVRYLAYSFKGKLRHEEKHTRLDRAEAGPSEQVLLYGRDGARAYSAAWRKLWTQDGVQLVPFAGARDGYVAFERGEAGVTLRALSPERGKAGAEAAIEGAYGALQVPGAVYVLTGKRLLRLNATTLAEERACGLPEGGARLRWSGSAIVFDSAGAVGALVP